MNFEELVKSESIETGYGDDGVWCAQLAWDYQQKKIDEAIAYMRKYSRDGRINCDSIREILSENP
ncbi:MAG: hypothetical protein [Caudoviricetes sp.]|nr:MAG: hypothetical protein [Caudoviricetes sp.]